MKSLSLGLWAFFQRVLLVLARSPGSNHSLVVADKMSIKEEVINEIIRVEGGYVDDPDDSGGETNFGITIGVARKYGYYGPMKDLSRDLAFQIYADKYWNPLNLDAIEELSPSIAKELADTGVNMGIGRAADFLQQSLNALNNGGSLYPDIAEDMDIGPATMGALKAYLKKRGTDGELVLHRMLNCLQGAFYVSLSRRRQKDEKFVYGWFKHRVV